jgi:hypothetical protein
MKREKSKEAFHCFVVGAINLHACVCVCARVSMFVLVLIVESMCGCNFIVVVASPDMVEPAGPRRLWQRRTRSGALKKQPERWIAKLYFLERENKNYW